MPRFLNFRSFFNEPIFRQYAKTLIVGRYHIFSKSAYLPLLFSFPAISINMVYVFCVDRSVYNRLLKEEIIRLRAIMMTTTTMSFCYIWSTKIKSVSMKYIYHLLYHFNWNNSKKFYITRFYNLCRFFLHMYTFKYIFHS